MSDVSAMPLFRREEGWGVILDVFQPSLIEDIIAILCSAFILNIDI